MSGPVRTTISAAAFAAVLAFGLAAGEAAGAAQELSKWESYFAELAKLPAAERQARLIEAAKKEGKIAIAMSVTRDGKENAKLFTAKYPFITETAFEYKASAASAEQFVAEETAGRHLTDAMEINTPDLGMILEKDMVARYRTPATDRIRPNFKVFLDPQDRFVPYYVNEHGIGYNPKMLERLHIAAPTSYEDLCDPRFKDNNSFDPPETRLITGLYEMFGRDEAKLVAWMKCIGENSPITMRGHSQRAMLLLAGDHAVSADLIVYDGARRNMENPEKAPFKVVYEAPLLVNARAVVISKNANNPNRAALYADHMLDDDTQALFFSYWRGTMTGKHPFLPDDAKLVPYTYIDDKRLERLHGFWRKYISNGKS